jgi:hypothetical protein
MSVTRVFGALVYLAATGIWMILMGIVGALRCDDSCSATSSSWADDPSSWQYDVLPWLGVVGTALAVVAVGVSLYRHVLGVAALGLHVGVFVVNIVLLTSGRDINALSLLIPAPIAIGAAYVAVGGTRPRAS